MHPRTIITLTLALALAPACGPPDLTFVSRRYTNIQLPDYNESFEVIGDRVRAEDTDRFGAPRVREATLTPAGLLQIENGTQALEHGWDGPYGERCYDCLSPTAYTFLDGSEELTILLRSLPPVEFEPLANVVNTISGDVVGCDQESLLIRDCVTPP